MSAKTKSPSLLRSASPHGPATQQCCVCTSLRVSPVFELRQVPISCNTTQSSYEAARSVPRGDIRLGVCHDCGHLFNLSFDPNLMAYTPGYENSLTSSPNFRRYLESLALRLVDKYQLQRKNITEIACGNGEFLQLLCELGNNDGVGFDPSYNGTRQPAHGNITFVTEPFPANLNKLSADFIACRHALEHVDKPRDFLAAIRRLIANRRDVNVYLEVPNSLFTVRDQSVWDIIYEHCSYFCLNSLFNAFAKSGFEVLEAGEEYEGQFISVSGRPADAQRKQNCSQVITESRQIVLNNIENLQNTFLQKLRYWENKLLQIKASGKKALVWGAGSKGIMFLNSISSASRMTYIIDVNPRKHGMYAPGSGQQIVGPQLLKQQSADYLIVMNPIYTEEIIGLLGEMDLTSKCEVIVV